VVVNVCMWQIKLKTVEIDPVFEVVLRYRAEVLSERTINEPIYNVNSYFVL